MAKFLAIYHGAAEAQTPELNDTQQTEFLDAWAKWAQTHGHALVDPGAPLFAKKRLSAHGVEDFTDTKTGYAVVETEHHEAAVRIFSEHPHLTLFPGNWIEVLECPPAP